MVLARILTGRQPIEERGGRTFKLGTIYWSARNQAFMQNGQEHLGPVPIDRVSGRVSWTITTRGRFALRDETGQFIPSGSVFTSSGTSFGRGTKFIQSEVVTGQEQTVRVGADSQIIERIYIQGPDGKVQIKEIFHGLGKDFSAERQGKQWFRKVGAEGLGLQAGKFTTAEIQGFVIAREVVLETNVGLK